MLRLARSGTASHFDGRSALSNATRYDRPTNRTVRPPSFSGYWTKTSPPSPAYVTNMVAADFTGDGLDDLLVALGHWPTTEHYPVQLLVNDGAGHLVNGTPSVFQGHIPETVFPYKTVVADFNGDKIADLFIADTGEDVANPRGWYSPLILSAPGGHLVDGTPNLPQQRAYTYYTDAADVNGDGTLDLYLGNTQT